MRRVVICCSWRADVGEAFARYCRLWSTGAFTRYHSVVLPDWGGSRQSSRAAGEIRPELTAAQQVLGTFQIVVDALRELSPAQLRDAVAFVDTGFYHAEPAKHWNPLLRGTTTSDATRSAELLALLRLAFPEVHWIDLGLAGSAPKTQEQSGVASWLADGPDKLMRHAATTPRALFDPYGIRESIRAEMRKPTDAVEPASYLVERDTRALAIDEEQAYAFLHAYVAYRLGHLCRMVTTEAGMEALKLGDPQKQDDGEIALSLEDLFLNFPDRTSALHLSDLQTRDNTYTRLKNVARRVFVTAGHRHYDYEMDNRTYLARFSSKVRFVAKPCGGLYNLLGRSRLLSAYRGRRTREWRAARPTQMDDGESSGHSAAGRLLLVAESLISRAEAILESAQSVPDCIHGAMLALEAQELLGYRTPTTSLEAITLRHKLEVKAECMFQGMDYNIEVKERFREIHGEVQAVSRWFKPSARKRSALNAEMSVVTEITGVFQGYGQFDEELECRQYFRRLHRRAYFARHPWAVPLFPFRWYVDTLLGSFWLFVAALPAWPVVLGLLGFTLHVNYGAGVRTIGEYVANAVYTFFGLQPACDPLGAWGHVLSLVSVLAGFTHLGIFISHLYTLVSRK